MYAVTRTYTGKGSKELFDLLDKSKSDVEQALRGVKGFVSYTLMRSGDGGTSMTICRDKAGVDESNRTAQDWIAKHASGLSFGPVVTSEGSVIIHAG